MIKEFTEHEKSIAAAAYLQGLALGLATARSRRWHQRRQRSMLATTRVFGTVAEILNDGCASNPLLIYEMRSLAEQCGLFRPLDEARELIAAAADITPKETANRA
jgi:hypothetical protein